MVAVEACLTHLLLDELWRWRETCPEVSQEFTESVVLLFDFLLDITGDHLCNKVYHSVTIETQNQGSSLQHLLLSMFCCWIPCIPLPYKSQSRICVCCVKTTETWCMFDSCNDTHHRRISDRWSVTNNHIVILQTSHSILSWLDISKRSIHLVTSMFTDYYSL